MVDLTPCFRVVTFSLQSAIAPPYHQHHAATSLKTHSTSPFSILTQDTTREHDAPPHLLTRLTHPSFRQPTMSVSHASPTGSIHSPTLRLDLSQPGHPSPISVQSSASYQHPHQLSAASCSSGSTHSHSAANTPSPHSQSFDNSLGLVVEEVVEGDNSITNGLGFHTRPSLGHRSLSSCSSVSSTSSSHLDLDFGASDVFSPPTFGQNDYGNHHGGTSYGKHVPPSESPYGIARSISGLYLESMQHPGSNPESPEHDQQHNDMHHHHQLLAMSQDEQDQFTHEQQANFDESIFSLAPPPMPRGLPGYAYDSGEQEHTPMPAATKTIEGQMAEFYSKQPAPATPAHGAPTHSRRGASLSDARHFSMSNALNTPASDATTPAMSYTTSPFGALTAFGNYGLDSSARLHRADSIDSFNTSLGGHSPDDDSQMGKMMERHSSMAEPSTPFRLHADEGDLQSPVHFGSSSMSRIASAPSFAGAHISALSSSSPSVANNKKSQDGFAIPSTPASASRGADSAQQKSNMGPPSTPLRLNFNLSTPQSAPVSAYPFVPWESPLQSVSGLPASAGKQKRQRQRPAGPPPLIVSSSDKVHVCYCGKKFKRMEHLKRHNKVHTKEKPYACTYPGCIKAFGRSDNLAQHIKTHFKPSGFNGVPHPQLLAAARKFGQRRSESRHDPHAAATAAAAAAAAISANMATTPELGSEQQEQQPSKRRCTISEGVAPSNSFAGFQPHHAHAASFHAPTSAPGLESKETRSSDAQLKLSPTLFSAATSHGDNERPALVQVAVNGRGEMASHGGAGMMAVPNHSQQLQAFSWA